MQEGKKTHTCTIHVTITARQSQTADSAPDVATWEVTWSAPKVVPCVTASVGLQLVLLRTFYSQAQGCVCTALQLGGDVEQPWLMSKYDVMHRTGSTQRITTPPQEDRATAMHKFWWILDVQFRRYDRWQTNTRTDRHTDTLITILRFRIGGGVTNAVERTALMGCCNNNVQNTPYDIA